AGRRRGLWRRHLQGGLRLARRLRRRPRLCAAGLPGHGGPGEPTGVGAPRAPLGQETRAMGMMQRFGRRLRRAMFVLAMMALAAAHWAPPAPARAQDRAPG